MTRRNKTAASSSEAELTRDSILGKDDRCVKRMSVPEWGGAVYIRIMDGGRRGLFEAAVATDKVNAETIRGLLAALCLCDKAGNYLFKPEDADALNQKSSIALDRFFGEAAELNQIADKSKKKLEKNS